MARAPEITKWSGKEKLPSSVVLYNTRLKASLLRWISPFEFYIRLNSHNSDIECLINKMQEYYKNDEFKKINCRSRNYVVTYYKEKSEYVRGEIINSSQDEEGKLMYTIKSLDYGSEIICCHCNVYELDDLFMTLPATAVRCSFERVIMNVHPNEVDKRIKQCIHFGALQNIECEFIGASSPIPFIDNDDNFVFAELFINCNTSVKQLFAENDIITILPAQRGMLLILGS